ncbi:PaaI family thioesterase [Nocardia sp. NPDC050175]|uniref:PaaI family thioesterase n=1 Tax=Nocardia sp. NPDC050175 TaxID=3364317 RepID=UPI0037A92872
MRNNMIEYGEPPVEAQQLPVDQQLISRMGITIDLCGPGQVRGHMPVDGNRQPVGILHGGANAVLAETLGSLAAFLHAGPRGSAVGIDLSCTHHRWVASGDVTGVCTPLFEGDRFASYAIEITDQWEQLTCTARLTAAITPARQGRTQ